MWLLRKELQFLFKIDYTVSPATKTSDDLKVVRLSVIVKFNMRHLPALMSFVIMLICSERLYIIPLIALLQFGRFFTRGGGSGERIGSIAICQKDEDYLTLISRLEQ